MNDAETVEYDDLLEMVEAGVIVACAPTRNTDGTPGLVWLAAPLDGQAAVIALTADTEPKRPDSGNSESDELRAAQATGLVWHLRSTAARAGRILA